MSDQFDPYYTWLGIPPEEQPPDVYRLLGIRRFESNLEVISNAIDQRMAHVRSFQTGKRAAHSQELLNVLSKASGCLFNPEKKEAYDRELRQKDAPQEAEANAALPQAKPLAIAMPKPDARRPAAAPASSSSPNATAPLAGISIVVDPHSASVPRSSAPAKASRTVKMPVVVVGAVVVAGVSIGALVLVGGLALWGVFGRGDSKELPKANELAVNSAEAETSKADVRPKLEPGKVNVPSREITPPVETNPEPRDPSPESSSEVIATNPSAPAAVSKPKPPLAERENGSPTSTADSAPNDSFLESSLRLDGQQYVEIENTAALPCFRENYTIEVWCQSLSEGREGPDSAVISNLSDSNQVGSKQRFAGLRLGLIRQNGTTRFIADGGVGDRIYPLYADMAERPWHHLAWIATPGGKLLAAHDGKIARINYDKQFLSLPVANLRLGAKLPPPAPAECNVLIRAVRVSSIARYESDFDPPQTFDKDGSTVVLFDFTRPNSKRMTDLSGHGHHGRVVQLNSSQRPQPATKGFALQFDGRHFVELEGTARIASWNKPSTAELWVRWSPQGGKQSLLGTLWQQNPDRPHTPWDGWWLTVDNSSGKLEHWFVYPGQGGASIFPVGPYSRDDGWHHVAYTHDERGLEIYIDGLLGEKFKLNWPSPAAAEKDNLFLGMPGIGNPETEVVFRGEVCAFRLSSTKRYSQSFTPPASFDKDEHTVALLDFSKGTGETIADLSGQGHHGKIVGAKWVRATNGTTLAASGTNRPTAPAEARPGGEVANKPASPAPKPPFAPRSEGVQPPAKGFALLFEGAQCVELAKTHEVASWNQPATAEVWVRWSPDAHVKNFMGTVWRDRGSVGGWGFTISRPFGKSRVEHNYRDPKDGTLSGAFGKESSSDLVWHHVAYSYDEKDLHIFLDGKGGKQLAPRWPAPREEPRNNLFLGTPDIGERNVGTIEICAFRLSSIKRYSQEFEPPATFEKDKETIVLLDFSKVRGDVITDLSGKSHHGKVMGGRWIKMTSTAPAVGASSKNPSSTNPVTASPPKAVAQPDPPPQTLPEIRASSEGPRLAVPAAAEQEKVRAQVRSLFKQDFTKAARPSEKIVLAQKFAIMARDPQEPPATRYVLFEEARTLNLDAGDVASAFEIVDNMISAFDVDPWKLKLSALKKGAEAGDNSARSRLAAFAVQMGESALAAGEFDAAGDVAAIAIAVAGRAGDAKLKLAARNLQTGVDAGKKQHQLAQLAFERLKTEPENPKANLAWGKFVCLVRRDWSAGLPYLAKGEDEPLKAAAELDLTLPTQSEKQAALADAWWAIAHSVSGREKTSVLLRAIHWYEKSLQDAGGLTRLRLQKRIEEANSLLSK